MRAEEAGLNEILNKGVRGGFVRYAAGHEGDEEVRDRVLIRAHNTSITLPPLPVCPCQSQTSPLTI